MASGMDVATSSSVGDPVAGSAEAEASESDFDIDIDAEDLIPGMEDPVAGSQSGAVTVASLKATKSMLGFEDGSSSGSSSEGEAAVAETVAAPLGLLAAASAASAASASVASSREAPPTSTAAPLPPAASAAEPLPEVVAVAAAASNSGKARATLMPNEEAPLPAPSVAPSSCHSEDAADFSAAAQPRHPLDQILMEAPSSHSEAAAAPRHRLDQILMEVNDPTPAEADLFTSVAPAVDAEELQPVEAKVSGRPREVAQPAAAAALEGFTPTSEAEFGPVEETKETKVEGVEAAAPSAASTVAASNESSRESGERRLATVAAAEKTATPAAASSASREEWDDIARQNEISPQNDPVESDSSDLEKEWEEIALKTEELAKNAREAQGVAAAKQDLLSTPISYKEVTQWLLMLEINKEALQEFRELVEDDSALPCGCFKRSRPRSDVPGLDKKLWAERDLVLFLKVTHFDFNDTVHHRMLRTIYGKLSRNKVCPTIGRHWEVLGFQGGDPRTDLNRSGGVLNVLQMFYFFSHHFDLLKAAYLLAQDVQQNYPLFCVSINLTKMVIEALLAGKLSKLCNSGSKGVFDTCCQMHSAALYHFYWRWRTQKRSIEHTELTFNEVRALLFRRPAKLLEMLEQGIAESKAKSDPTRLEFTELDFGAARPKAAKAKATASLPTRLWQYQARE